MVKRQKHLLPQRGNSQKDEIPSCHSVANSKTIKVPPATVWQMVKRQKHCLPQRGKGQNDEIPSCHSVAKGKKINLPVTIKSKTSETGRNQSAQPAKRRALRVSRRCSGVRETTTKQFMKEYQKNLSGKFKTVS
ncbi:MAG: hypothetical protein LBV47_05595 [Bacteroidales bacterium]|jgi:hypothetical protein|nr:hypothetical protein [Bacteroidales bacterium]